MRFIPNGPDIPDELLYAQDEGNVVFFCGAGVSMAYEKLSSFGDLAERVITDLGATEESKAKKLFSKFIETNKDPLTRGVISADHIFSGLVRSFDRHDINCSVSRNLKPKKEPNLKAHKIILKLAKSQGGQTRLVTTNFDLLFEECNSRLKSVTRSNLPHIQFSDNNWGIVHLHGKVKKDYTQPDKDGFVLSSSEFGDAYLAQGWARNFVKDILDKFVAVFIGYSADDPPIRYLLEGLQERSTINRNIYAFQSADEEAVAQWNEKGVTPIVYDVDASGAHSSLWGSLDAWGARTKSPTAWKNKLLNKARKGPTKLSAHERGMVAHLIASKSGARAFMQASPPMPSEWLCVFDPAIRLKQVQKRDYLHPEEEVINPYQLYGIDSDPPPSDRNEEFSQEEQAEAWNAFSLIESDYEDLDHRNLTSIRGTKSNDASILPTRLNYLVLWLAKVADQRITPWWAGQQLALHPDLLWQVRNELDRNSDNNIPKPILESWNSIFELSQFYGMDGVNRHDDYALKSRIKSFGWSNFFVREYAKVSAPYLKRGSLYNFAIPRDNRKKIRANDLIRLDVEYPNGLYDIKVPNEYIEDVVCVTRKNLEYAVDLRKDYSAWFRDIEPIEPDEEGDRDSRAYDLSGYVLHYVRLFKQLKKFDINRAKEEFQKWRKTDPVFLRLRVWAVGQEGLVNQQEFTDEILALSDDDFWSFYGERDLMLTLKNKWNELSVENRKLIEKRIVKGPPR